MTDHDGRDRTTARVASLIELGRDREAAEVGAAAGRDRLASGHDDQQRRGGHMQALEQLDLMGPELGSVIERITADQLDRPTPCAEFTVRGVLGHMVGGATVFAAAFRDQPAPEPPTGNELEDIGPALSELLAAMREPGALDRTVAAPFGEVSGDTFARFLALDGIVHGWDLATATGQPYDPPEALIAEVEAFARDTIDPLRDGDTFADAVEPPTDATPIERLVAFTGRDVTGGQS